MLELVDRPDLKSGALYRACGFESLRGYIIRKGYNMGLMDGMTFEQEHGKDIWKKKTPDEVYPKYLVRPNDMMIWEIDESNGCYRICEWKEIKNRPNAYEHSTYENLTKNYHFFPIGEEELDMYKYFNKICYEFMSWQGRPDGHGGSKGGTFTEFLEYHNIYKK